MDPVEPPRLKIPVIDLQGCGERELRWDQALAKRVDRALAAAGTFVLTGHGLSGAVLEAVRDEAEAFFSQPEESKRSCQRPRRAEVARGYLGVPDSVVSAMGMQRFSFGRWPESEAEGGRRALALHPTYFSCEEGRAHFPANRFPASHTAFERAAQIYFRQVQRVSRKVAVLFEGALQLAPGRLLNTLDGPLKNRVEGPIVVRPGDGQSMTADLIQVFISTDVAFSGLRTLGRLIELQAQQIVTD